MENFDEINQAAAELVSSAISLDIPNASSASIETAIEVCKTVTYFEPESHLGAIGEEQRLLKVCGLISHIIDLQGNTITFTFDGDYRYALVLCDWVSEEHAETIVKLLRQENELNSRRREEAFRKILPQPKPITNDIERQALINRMKEASEFIKDIEF